MVNVLVGNKDSNEFDALCHELTNDKNFEIKNVTTGFDTISSYWKLHPDILVIDNNLTDMSVRDIVEKLSCSPVEQKRCNTILVMSKNSIMELNNVTKINSIIYKPIFNNELTNKIKTISSVYYTPDLQTDEVDLILQTLNFNFMSVCYRYMKDAIIYCYYKPEQLEYLKNVVNYIAFKHNVPFSKVRDTLKASIRPYNSINLDSSSELYNILYNNKQNISLKDFLERIVYYLIRKKGRFF